MKKRAILRTVGAIGLAVLLSVAVGASVPTSSAVGQCAVAKSCYFHSLTCVGAPIGKVSQRMSPESTVDGDGLRLSPTSVISMRFSIFNGMGASALAMATGLLVSGCGGGGGADDASATVQAAVSSSTSATTAATASALGATVSGTSATSAGVVGGVITGGPVSVPSNGSGGTTLSGSSGASGTRSLASMNLGGLSYYLPELPTIDVMKRAGPWLTQCPGSCTGLSKGASGWDTLEEASLNLDADGWVKSLPASNDAVHKYRAVATMLSANGALPLGRYIVRYDGQGTITYNGFTKSSLSTAGRDVIDLTSTDNVWITISATNPSNYLRNIRIYMPGGACAKDLTVYAASAAACNTTTGAYVPFESFPATQIWNPQFLQDIKGFRALRFMDWSLTNTTTVATWAQRTTLTSRIWTAASGVPIETMLDLANQVGADAWLNVPAYADDDYAAQMGALAATHLTSGVSKMYLEYGNELWNYAFPATGWVLNQAKAKWPQLVAQGVNPYTLAYSWYGERLAQVCRAAKAGSSLVRCVMNTQAANSWITDQYLSCSYAAAELGHQCAKDVDVVAIAPYFGGYISNASLRSVVATWYSDADGGLGKLFQEINGTDASGAPAASALLSAAGSGAPNGALALAKTWTVATKAVADKYGLPIWAYEGGQGLALPMGDSDQKLQSLFVAANRDARMGAAYDRMISDWKAAGGQSFAYFNHVSSVAQSGMWGLKESMTDNANPKWLSALKVRNTGHCTWAGC